VRWSASIGATIGLLMGIFEARAITRALAAEQYRLKQETLQRQRDQLEQFASVVSHDLRNPLQTLSGRMELLQQEYESDHLEKMEQTIERMDTIVEDTLTLARQGQTVSDTAPVELGTVARESWTVAETGDASLHVENSFKFLADKSRLHHVFENLFRNAQAHGGDAVTVWVGTLEAPTGFYVEDTGPGIPVDRRDTVFDPAETTASSGSGFGLTIVQEVVEAHGWEITVTEGREGGARFEITQVAVPAG
jgi:signal transduction histidine kinase